MLQDPRVKRSSDAAFSDFFPIVGPNPAGFIFPICALKQVFFFFDILNVHLQGNTGSKGDTGAAGARGQKGETV